MNIILTIKAVLNYLYNHLIDLINVRKIVFADGTEQSTASSSASLFDIKVMSQAIADKGWAFMCHTTRQDLAKADVPTLYNDILNKLNNSEKEMQPLTRLSLNGQRILYSNTLNKWFYSDETNGNIYITDNLTTSTVYLSNTYITEMICGNNIFIAYAYMNNRYVVKDLHTDETKTLNMNNVPLNSGAIRSIIKDNYIYVCPIARDNYFKIYKFYDDFSITNFETITFSKYIYDIQYDNGYWYVLLADGVYKGTDINNPSSFTKIHQDDIHDSSFLIVKDNFSCYLKGRGNHIIYTYDLYQSTNQTVNNFDILYASAIKSYPKLLNNLIWTQNRELKIMSININNFTTFIDTTINDVQGLDIDYNNNTVVYGSNNNMYFTGLVNKQFTDTYNINGTTVNINYYKYQDFKICISDNGGTNDTNLETVFNYLGYLNYWLLDYINEFVCVQRDKNTYSAMFVGDNYVDDLEDIPANNYSAVALKKYVDEKSIDVSNLYITPYALSTLVSATKGTVYGKTTKPTLIIFGELPPNWNDDWQFYLKVSTDNNNWENIAYWHVGSGDPSSSPMNCVIIGVGLYWQFTCSKSSYTLKYAPLYI